MSLVDRLRWMRAASSDLLGLNRRARARLDGSRAAVLNYHRVIPDEQARSECVEEGMHVTPGTFARQLDWLESEFHILPLHEIVSRLAEEKPLPRGACAITFDDGWRDNHQNALPELARRSLPATVFVVSERVGTTGPFWPDVVSRRLHAVEEGRRRALVERFGANPDVDPIHAMIVRFKELEPPALEEALAALALEAPALGEERRELMTWDELDALSSAGISIESHAATHAILPNLGDDAVEWELRHSRERLRERGHGRDDLLAYPVGEQGARERRLAREAGYRAAFTIIRGLAGSDQDRLAMPRLMIHEGMSASRAEFLLRVPGWD